jgi:hypothetical protein
MHIVARRSTRYLALVFASFVALSGAQASTGASPNSRLLVKFKSGTSSASIRSALQRFDGSDLRTIASLNVHVVSIPSAQVTAALKGLGNSAAVAYAERDVSLAPQELLPNDPSFPQQFAIAGGAWGWYTTHTTQAWDITNGDPSVVVAVLDTGLKTQGLSDFDGQVVSGWNVLQNSSDTSSSAGNHGTYVAGVVGLAVGNGTGNAGYCPGCRVMPVQVGTDSGAYLSDLAAGLTWAADHRRPRREHELGGNELVVDPRERRQLRALKGTGCDGSSRELELQLPDVSSCDSRRDRGRGSGEHGHETRRLELRRLGQSCRARGQHD